MDKISDSSPFKLPPELVRNILKLTDAQTINNLSRTCKEAASHADPFMYEEVGIGNCLALESFLLALSKNRQRASFVRDLCIDTTTDCEARDSEAELIRRCKSQRHPSHGLATLLSMNFLRLRNFVYIDLRSS